MSGVHLDPAAFDAATGEARVLALRHLAACPECTARIAAGSPESLFALLALEPESPALLDDVSRAVARRLEPGRPSWIQALRERGLPRGAAAGIAAVAVLGCALALSRATRPRAGVVASAGEAGAARGGVTLVEPASSAQVIDLTVDGTQVVMIFDPEMKL